MKILFIFHVPWFKSGASKSGLSLVRGLTEKGHDVLAICPAEGTMSAELRANRIPVSIIRFEWAYPHLGSNFNGAVKFLPKLLRDIFINKVAYRKVKILCEEFMPDIIHSNSSVLDIGFKVAKSLGLPHVAHYREYGWKDTGAVMFHEKAMSRYPLQYGISIGKYILSHHDNKSGRNVLIYNGVIPKNTCRYNENKKDWFLYVGGIYEEKGIKDLLIAYARLSSETRKKHNLMIAGSPNSDAFLSELKTLSSHLGIINEVVWLGERSDVADLMYDAKALIVPSFHEAFGRIVVEAMNNGCIVLGRNCDGIKEQFDNGLRMTGNEIGLRFDDIDELAKIMCFVVQNENAFFYPMVRRSQTVANQLYTTDAYVNQTEEFYRRIIEDK